MRIKLESCWEPVRSLGLIPAVAITLMASPPAWAAGGLHVRVQVKADNRAVVAGAAALGAVLILSQPRDAGRTGLSAPEEGFVIINATPPEARVFLDGRALGQARQLVARAFRLPFGKHTVEVVAPGFRPYRAQFALDPGFPTRLRVALEPE
jgi:hypothetical protein